MIKCCEVCGNTFECYRNKKTCSPECGHKLKLIRQKNYYLDHKEECNNRNKRWIENNRERYLEYQHNYAKTRWIKGKKCVADRNKKPSWVTKYNKADRLTKINMLSVALMEHNLGSTSYGYLSFIYGTDEYCRLEDKVFKVKTELEKGIINS